MRILFCNDSFPGNFEALARLLAADSANEVLFLSMFVRKDFSIPGVSRVRLRLNRDRGGQEKEKDAFFLSWEKAYRVGRQTEHTLMHLRESGFVPDMILASSADGVGLFLRHAFPESFIVSYFDRPARMPETQEERGRLTASICLQGCQLGQSNLYFLASEWQRKLFPPLLQNVVRIMPCFVDTDLFSPSACTETQDVRWRKHDERIVFHIKDIREEHFKSSLAAIEELISLRPQCHVSLCIGNKRVSHVLESMAPSWPEWFRRRVSVESFASLADYRNFLCNVSVHVFPDAAVTPLHEMLECMSCEGCLMVPAHACGSTNFLLPEENCLEWPLSSVKSQAKAVSHALDAKAHLADMGKKAREMVMLRYGQKVVLPAHIHLLKEEYESCIKRHRFG